MNKTSPDLEIGAGGEVRGPISVPESGMAMEANPKDDNEGGKEEVGDEEEVGMGGSFENTAVLTVSENTERFGCRAFDCCFAQKQPENIKSS